MGTMPEVKPAQEKPSRPVLHGTAAAFGACLFGLFVNSAMPWTLLSAAALLITALTIAYSFLKEINPPKVLGLLPFSRKVINGLFLGCAVGIVLALFFRFYGDLPLFPKGVGRFVVVAVGIGASEEILFRGYIQGRFQGLGWFFAPILASAAHTIYKLALFASPPTGVVVDYTFLAVWTLFAGIVFGGLREWSGSVFPPLAGHVLFDIIVYGERAHAPWWVWP